MFPLGPATFAKRLSICSHIGKLLNSTCYQREYASGTPGKSSESEQPHEVWSSLVAMICELASSTGRPPPHNKKWRKKEKEFKRNSWQREELAKRKSFVRNTLKFISIFSHGMPLYPFVSAISIFNEEKFISGWLNIRAKCFRFALRVLDVLTSDDEFSSGIATPIYMYI